MLDTSEYEDGVDGASERSKQLQADMAGLQSLSDALQNKVKTLSARFGEEKDKLKELSEKLNKAAEETGENSEETQKLAQEFSRAKEKCEKLGKELADTAKESANADKKLDELKKAAEGAGDGMKEASEDVKAASDKIAKAVAGAFTVAKIIEWGTVAIETAAEVKASYAQFEQTFTTGGKDLTKTAQNVMNTVSRATGVVASRLRDSGTKIYAFAKSSGADSAEAMSLMETALTAAADSAAYYDRSLEETTETLQSFLKGNYENDAALGVSATETTRNAAAMELFGQKFQDLTEIQKQQTLLKMVTDSQKLSGAMGQAAREADGWENVTGNLNAKWKEFIANVGTPVLEAAIPVIQFLTDDMEALAAGATVAGTIIGVSLAVKWLPKATVAVKAFTAALSANPFILAAVAAGALTFATIDEVSAINEAKEAATENAEAMAAAITTDEERQAKIAELNEEIRYYTELMQNAALAGDMTSEREYLQIIGEKQIALDALTTSTKSAADTTSVFEKATMASGNTMHKTVKEFYTFDTATTNYTNGLTNLMNKFQQTYTQTYNNISTWFSAYEKATYKAAYSTRDLLDAQKSHVEYNERYKENLEWLAENGLDAAAASFINMGEEGAEAAETLRREVEDLGGITSEAGSQLARDTEEMAKLEQEGLEELATTISEMKSPISEAALSLTEEYAKKLEGLDMSSETYDSTVKTLDAVLRGIEDKDGAVYAAVERMMAEISRRLYVQVNGIKVAPSNSNRVDSRNAGGLDYVPYNGYISELHRGEMVLTEREATDYRKGDSQGRGNVTFGDIIINYAGTGNTDDDIERIAEMLQFRIEQEAVALA